jgi:hypothetical protein
MPLTHKRLDIMTNIVRDVGQEMREAIEIGPPDGWKSLDQGCATTLVAAFDPGLRGASHPSSEDL